MTIEQRLEHLEQQNQRTQRTNKRLTVALTMMAVAMCAVVTMAATGDKDGHFDTVTARYIAVTNEAGDTVVDLSATDGGGDGSGGDDGGDGVEGRPLRYGDGAEDFGEE